MSKTAQTDDIDELLSSVRDFVSHKEPRNSRLLDTAERLVLTPDQRVSDVELAETPIFVDVSAVPPADNVLSIDTHKAAGRAGLEATIAELEAAVTAQPDDWEPDEGESFEQSAWAMSAFQMAHDDSVAEPEVAPLAAIEAPVTQDAPDPENDAEADENLMAFDLGRGIDEEALRALVLDVVRDELGGALGEKITRNVRKLVRREINRVLTSREME